MLTIVVASMASASCGGDKNDAAGTSDSTSTQTPDTTTLDHEGFAPTTNIRYIDSDSVLRAYDYAVKETKRLEQKSLELQQYQNSLTADVQKKAAEIQQKVQNNGYLTQQSYEADMQSLQTLQQNAEANYAKRAQALMVETDQVQSTIIKAIENYVIKYNQDKHYDAILLKQAGVYFNPELDITDDIIKGLNAELGNTTDEKENAEPAKEAPKAKK